MERLRKEDPPSAAKENPANSVEKPQKERRKAPRFWRERAEFLPATADFLRRCGIEPEYVNPTPLGEGYYNMVFEYIAPDGSEKVVKIPKAARKGYMSSGVSEDVANSALIHKFFGPYSVPSESRTDPATGNYLFIQDRVHGKTLTSHLETPEIRTQLADMARVNREMMRQEGASFDFIGVAGFIGWLRHRGRRLFSRKSDFEIANIIIDDTGRLKIVDDGLLRFKDVPVKQKVISNMGFATNRVIMRLYFGVDLQPTNGTVRG